MLAFRPLVGQQRVIGPLCGQVQETVPPRTGVHTQATNSVERAAGSDSNTTPPGWGPFGRRSREAPHPGSSSVTSSVTEGCCGPPPSLCELLGLLAAVSSSEDRPSRLSRKPPAPRGSTARLSQTGGRDRSGCRVSQAVLFVPSAHPSNSVFSERQKHLVFCSFS